MRIDAIDVEVESRSHLCDENDIILIDMIQDSMIIELAPMADGTRGGVSGHRTMTMVVQQWSGNSIVDTPLQ